MDVLRKGYWIGKSISFIPKDTLYSIERYFQLVENGHDVSVLSEPDIHFCFFFYEKKTNQALLITAIKICKNLRKNLVLIHEGEIEHSLISLGVIFDHINILNSDINKWLENLSNSINENFNEHSEVIDFKNSSSTVSKSSISKDILGILRYIELNLSKTIREEDVAEYCHYSVTYFSKVFHKSVGMSFRDYLTSKRISLAKQLLTKDRKTKIAFIAYQCGYKDVSYFSRIFKKKTGLSPGAYRHNN